jgi:hypothetical protein
MREACSSDIPSEETATRSILFSFVDSLFLKNPNGGDIMKYEIPSLKNVTP